MEREHVARQKGPEKGNYSCYVHAGCADGSGWVSSTVGLPRVRCLCYEVPFASVGVGLTRE